MCVCVSASGDVSEELLNVSMCSARDKCLRGDRSPLFFPLHFKHLLSLRLAPTEERTVYLRELAQGPLFLTVADTLPRDGEGKRDPAERVTLLCGGWSRGASAYLPAVAFLRVPLADRDLPQESIVGVHHCGNKR